MSTSWPTNPTVHNLSLPSSPKLEPSGLTFVTDSDGVVWLFVASDNGYLTKGSMNTDHTPPTISWSDAYSFQNSDNKLGDYESATVTGVDAVMVGIEGDAFDKPNSPDVPYPIIARFDTSDTSDGNEIGDFTGSQWELRNFERGAVGGNAGMEALTLVPTDACPSSWLLDSPLNQSGDSSYQPYYGGFFFVAAQSECGVIFVYDLVKGSGQSHSAIPFKNLPTMKATGFPKNGDGSSVSNNATCALQISDLFFEQTSQVLYVLYDGDTGNDYLQALTLNNDGTFTQKWAVKTPYVGCEGLAVYGSDLYLAVDLSSSQTGVSPLAHDGVYQLPGLIATMNNQVSSLAASA